MVTAWSDLSGRTENEVRSHCAYGRHDHVRDRKSVRTCLTWRDPGSNVATTLCELYKYTFHVLMGTFVDISRRRCLQVGLCCGSSGSDQSTCCEDDLECVSTHDMVVVRPSDCCDIGVLLSCCFLFSWKLHCEDGIVIICCLPSICQMRVYCDKKAESRIMRISLQNSKMSPLSAWYV